MSVPPPASREAPSQDPATPASAWWIRIVEDTTDGIWDWPDLEANHLVWSPQFLERLGYGAGDVEPTLAGFTRLIHPEDRARVAAEVDAAIAWKERFEYPCRLRDRRAEYRSFIVRGRVIRDAGGRALRAFGSLHELESGTVSTTRPDDWIFRSVFDIGPIGINVLALDLRFLLCNPRFCQLLGYAEEELVGRSFLEVTHPEDRPGNAALAEKLLDGSLPEIAVEKRYVRKDGTELWAKVTVTLLRGGKDGAPHAILVLVEDISEQRAAESALRRSERQLRTVFEASTSGLFLLSADGSLLEMNPAASLMFGYTAEEFATLSPDDFVLPESREEYARLEKAARVGESASASYQARHRNGTLISVDAQVIPLEGLADGRVLVINRNVTSRAIAEQALERSLAFSENLIQTAQVLVIGLDLEGRIQLFNPAAEQITGYSREELENRNWFETLVPRDRYPEVWQMFTSMQTGSELPRSFENPIRTKDGEERTIAWSNSEIRSGNETVGTISFGVDITERRNAEREREQAFAEVARLKEELERERDYLREEYESALSYNEIIGGSVAWQRTLSQVEAVSATQASVLIQGESGVGKELVAHAIHNRSARRSKPLVKVNCASIPKELFESEFFGHVKGAFTGALRDRLGRFQLADGGTIFLDEVSEIPLELQGKLLRVLQDGHFERVGDDATTRVDVRVVAATNRNLQQEVAAGRFRADLFYRLSVFPIEVLPLRQRKEDIPALAQHFLQAANRELRRSLELTPAQTAALQGYDWPGNVRELRNIIERAAILSRGTHLALELAWSTWGAQATVPPGMAREAAASAAAEGRVLTAAELRELQRANVIAALEQCGWKVAGKDGAAQLLGLRASTLASQIRALGIVRPQ